MLIPNIISAPVAMAPKTGISVSGIIGLICLVYSKKLSQLPQADTSAGHNPNLSATADKKPIPIPNH